jgi:hypothetical protein
MELSGQLHALAAFTPVEISTSSHLIESWMIPKAGLNILEKKKNLFSPLGIELWIVLPID